MDIKQMTPGNPEKGWKPELGIYAWDGDRFINASATGLSNEDVLVRCGFDGEPYVQFEGSVLVREVWARREVPGRAAVFDAIRACCLKLRVKSEASAAC